MESGEKELGAQPEQTRSDRDRQTTGAEVRRPGGEFCYRRYRKTGPRVRGPEKVQAGSHHGVDLWLWGYRPATSLYGVRTSHSAAGRAVLSYWICQRSPTR